MYPLRKSILEKIEAPHNSSSISSKRGIGWRYRIVMLLIALQSTHIRHVPSFLGTKITGTTQGLRLTRIYPLSRSACTCCRISFVSWGLVLYGARFGSVAPDIR